MVSPIDNLHQSVEHFRRRLCAETGKNIESVDDDVVDVLMKHDFRGNIRELENALQHAFVLCKDAVIQVVHLPKELRADVVEFHGKGPFSLVELEKNAIREVLLDNANNRTAAARQLGIDPSTLYRKMARYGIR